MGTLGLEFEKGLYLGIDFGTTNTVVSVFDYDQGDVYTLPLDGQMIMPTVVQFEEDHEQPGKLNTIYGIEAKEAAVIFPESTVMSIKRVLGKDNPITVMVGGSHYDFKPVDIVAQLLGHIKKMAGVYLQEEQFITGEFSGCVMTVPANSTDKQKHRMLQAAIGAGFIEEHIYLRLEPAAAAITYAKTAPKDSKVLVYDFGGGTFDACLLKLSAMAEEEPEISIMSTYGDNYLGGNDMDMLMMDMIYETFLESTKGTIDLFDLSKDDGVSKKQKKMAIVRLRQAATQAKERLSTTGSVKIVLAPFLQEPNIVNLNLEITREAYYTHQRQHQMDDEDDLFEMMSKVSANALIQRTIGCVAKCVEAAGIRPSDVDEVFLVGGSSAMPAVHEQIEAFFGKAPYQSAISPALSISQGAAHYCHMIMLPTVAGPRVIDTTIHPLGLEIAGRRFLEVIPEGLEIPEDGLVVEAEELLFTNFEDITSLAIIIYEDTEPMTGPKHLRFVHESGMKRLGGTTLNNIPEAAKGQEKVKVTFKLNRDNLLTVTAASVSQDGGSTVLSVDALY